MLTNVDKRRLEVLETAFEAIKEALEFEKAKQAYDGREYLTTAEFASLTGHAPKTISNYVSKGKLSNAKKKGGLWLIHKTELQRFTI